MKETILELFLWTMIVTIASIISWIYFIYKRRKRKNKALARYFQKSHRSIEFLGKEVRVGGREG